MKKIKYIYLLIILGFMLFTGCHDVDVDTVIHQDGSCTRTIVIDSSHVDETFFPISFSGVWNMTLNKKDGDMIFNYTFPSVKLLAEEMNYELERGKKIKIHPKLEKRFRWFYTYFRYSETYESVFDYNHIPFEKFFTEQEIENMTTTPDSTDSDSLLDKKFENWLQDNFFEEFYQNVEALVKSGKLEMTASQLLMKKQGLKKLFLDDQLSDFDMDELTDNDLGMLADVLGTESVYHVKNELGQVIFEMIQEIAKLAEVQLTSFTHRVTMPGLVLDANAKTIEGNTATWNVPDDLLFYQDYDMWIESRVMNRAFTIGTLVLAFILIVILIIAVIQKGRKKKA